jgi:preprotein translocase subunit SecD
MSNLRWKLVTITVIFVAFAAVGVYPLLAAWRGIHSPAVLMDKQLKLGLDLKGGVHLVLRVKTDDALRLETEIEMERLREELTKRTVPITSITLVDPAHFRVEGVPPAQAAVFRQAAAEVATSFERDAGTNGTYTFTMRPNLQVSLRSDAVVQGRETIERRVNELGVTEPSIAQQGTSGDQILVQLPGVTDVGARRKSFATPAARAEDRRAGPGGHPRGAAGQRTGPGRHDIVPGVAAPGDAAERCSTSCGRWRRSPARSAQRAADGDENNQPAVGFTLNNDGAAIGKVTGENIGKQLAILDGRVIGAAHESRYRRRPDHRQLHAGGSAEPVADWSGALSASMDYMRRTIGPSLA